MNAQSEQYLSHRISAAGRSLYKVKIMKKKPELAISQRTW